MQSSEPELSMIASSQHR